MGFQITQDAASDRVLDDHPFALLAGMMLDQQYSMDNGYEPEAHIVAGQPDVRDSLCTFEEFSRPTTSTLV